MRSAFALSMRAESARIRRVTAAEAIKAAAARDSPDKTPVFNADSGKYVAEYLFEGLTKNTGYTIKAVAISANGAVAATGTATTAND